MKKRRQVVMVAPGKDVTLYIPTDTPPEVIRYLNRLKAEGNFSQGIMEILTGHILEQPASTAMSPIEEASTQWDDLRYESSSQSSEVPEPVIPVDTAQDVQKPFSPQDILRQAARNAGKLLRDGQ
ncbi:hypothetical protein [Paenibacillus harenae]|uniref:hypothetical protein n=1 Tax=Paenibacillus harenae TaxID=306543 RepID=UPI00278F5394|nr:hypothetical protein [Paenibacillus harenae]MDQ0061672.1 hypothetical protein [Paenibacillus harenae]